MCIRDSHLTDDNLDMLIGDIHALLTVHAQNFLDEVVVHCVSAADPQDIVGVQSTVGQLGTGFDDVAVLHLQAGMGHRIGAGISVVGSNCLLYTSCQKYERKEKNNAYF